MHIDRILVPTNYRDSAERAAELAALIARRVHGQVVLLHIDELAQFEHRTDPAWVRYMETHTQQRQAESEVLHERVRKWAFSAASMTERGSPREVIPAVAETIDADLVVISSKCDPDTVGLGSTAARVLRVVDRPILIVPYGSPPRSEWRIDRILVPIDFQETAEAGLRAAYELSNQLDVSLSACTVVVWPKGMGLLAAQEHAAAIPELSAALSNEAMDALSAFTQKLNLGHIPIQVVGGEHPAEAIIEHAHEIGADMIVLPSLGKGAVARFLLGSTSERLAKTSDIPVLILPRRMLVADDAGADSEL